MNRIKRNIEKKRKRNLLISLLISLFLSINLTNAYFYTESKITNDFKTTSYTFNLNGNGGTFNSSNVEVKNNNTILPIPERTGYTFIGYAESVSESAITSNEVNDLTLINDKTVYAKWSLKNYSITYNLNGGTISGQKTSYDITSSFTLVKPTKTGYDFTGWTGSNGTTPQTTVTVPAGTTGKLSYTANWKKIDAAITGVTVVSYRSTDYGKTYETWYGNADGYYKVGTSNENVGNWDVTVNNYSISIVGTTKVTSENRYYRFYIYSGNGTSKLLGVAEDHPVEYRGSGTKAQIKYSW